MTTSTVRTAGGSLVLTIPQAVLSQTGIRKDDIVKVEAREGRIILSPQIDRTDTLEDTPELRDLLDAVHAGVDAAVAAVRDATAAPVPQASAPIDRDAIRKAVQAEYADGIGEAMLDVLASQYGPLGVAA